MSELRGQEDADGGPVWLLGGGGDSADRDDELFRPSEHGEAHDVADVILAHRVVDVLRRADTDSVDRGQDVVRLELADCRHPRLQEVDAGAGRLQRDLLAGRLQGHRRCDLLGAAHVLDIDLRSLRIIDARRVDGACGEDVGAVVEPPAEDALEERGLPDDHVDEVDGSVGGVVAARHRDERRDGVCGVG